ncbi:S1 RNA-binding domain-containing protein [Streptomyces sp. NPDC051064]|uniref:S1 RNA-binding domain-containing protein n=1 Tax=Streptomyces sp. NPDC051064 TaxID=3365641 RepID=UPI003796DA53
MSRRWPGPATSGCFSWRHISHPSEVVSPGQEISAEILGIDLARERVTMSRKALRRD